MKNPDDIKNLQFTYVARDERQDLWIVKIYQNTFIYKNNTRFLLKTIADNILGKAL